MRTLLALSLFASIAVIPVFVAANGLAELGERMRLWTGCRSMQFIVDQLPDRAYGIGLDEKSVGTVVHNKLLAKRLYDAAAENTGLFLFVRINVVGGIAASIEVQLWKPMYDTYLEIPAPAATWTYTSTGFLGVGEGTDEVLAALSGIMDMFISEYLRVNEDSCT